MRTDRRPSKYVPGDAFIEDEDGLYVDACDHGLQLILSAISETGGKSSVKDTCCLRFLDPYGDTTFNQLQIPQLLAELRELRSRFPSSDVRVGQSFEELLRFVEKAESLDGYLKFYGD